jgi:hypothetical protein
MQSTKLLFFLAVWKRPEITEICFMGLNRLKNTGKFPMEFLAVISEEEMIPLCEKYGVQWVMHENLPLGRKKNFGLREALKKEFDYLVELGSDDLIKDELLELYRPSFERRVSMIGMTSFAFIDSATGRAKLYKVGTMGTFGLARCFRRDVLESIGDLWPDGVNKGLDNASHLKLLRHGVFGKRLLTHTPVAVDIKSEVNIWSYDALQGTEITFEEAVEGLSKEEINAIQCLQLKELER